MGHVFEVVEAKPHHIGQIVHRLRAEHLSTLADVGIGSLTIHKRLQTLYRESAFRRSWMIDGRLAALGGVTGMLLSSEGFIWLALSEDALRFPVAIIKEARRQLRSIMVTRRELATTIIGSDDVALRFATFLGFHGTHDADIIGPKDQLRALKTNPKGRIPVGSGFAVAVGYHEGAF